MKIYRNLSEGFSQSYAEYLYYNRACCYVKLGEIDKAIMDLRKSILIQPKIIDMARKIKILIY